MTLTNHLLTGAALAKFLPLPVAVPLAFTSHLVLDAVPHFGFKTPQIAKAHSKLWVSVTVLDIMLAIVLAIWFIKSRHPQWLIVGLVAYSPDFVWIYRFTIKEKFGKLIPGPNKVWFNRLHEKIQKLERPWGGLVEIVYATCMLLVLR